jgi:hypothetical protein
LFVPLIGRSVPKLLLSTAVVALGVLGCGGDDGASPTVARTAPQVTTRTAGTTAEQPSTTPTATAPTATTGVPPEDQEGGAGDEEPARVPAAFAVEAGRITPKTITVPAFLTVELRLTAKAAPAKVTLDAPGGETYDVAAGGTARVEVNGLKPGDYPVRVEDGGTATLHVVSGGAPGP